ncbi:hypothetical protein Glove_325g5 [Diversispora epigaea]|uniref:Uncharacterized protein n=1 Tax=Diversispora epigaea TaxID=1348612 RepID=A0A397HSV2_9GLOM|nr:hypothetical protein Glove_325g5 [Diversispora epigaea]
MNYWVEYHGVDEWYDVECKIHEDGVCKTATNFLENISNRFSLTSAYFFAGGDVVFFSTINSDKLKVILKLELGKHS